MSKDILYLGDTKLDQAASYLAGIMSSRNIEFDYIASDTAFTDELFANDYKGIIISDYPSANLSSEQLDRICEKVKAGVGLLMIGGWDTFTGLDGGYNKTVLKDVLPVAMSETDDRINSCAPCMIEQNITHEIIDSISFDKNPAVIAGYNQLIAKDGSETVLSVKKYLVSKGQDFSFTCERTDPLLVLGLFGEGRVVAYASDVAPHWAAGFVDWGDERITLQADGAEEVEVGNWYIKFFENIINWICSMRSWESELVRINMPKGNAIIGQSGGPTSVINASLAGVIEAAKDSEAIAKVYGMRFGIEGFMAENIIDLSAESAQTIEGLKTTPSSALGSCRHKLKDDDLPKILEVLEKNNIRYIFLIGGNDTMDTIGRVEAYAKDNAYDLICVGIPKTVDNDLFGTDHTPGFPSAARYMALSVAQAGVLARDMQKVDQFVIFQCIGREAGWLVGATALGKTAPEDAPHIMCFPERAFEKNKFLADVKKCYDQFGFVSIVCGEGITYADGTAVSASKTKDKFGNLEFGAMGGTSVAAVLHRMISDEYGFRGEFQITESLSMCAADRAVQIDINEAYICGQKAVELAAAGTTGVMVTLERLPGEKYGCTTGTAPLSEVAIKAKPMGDEYINSEGNFVTDKFVEYIKPLVGDMPQYVKLNYKGSGPIRDDKRARIKKRRKIQTVLESGPAKTRYIPDEVVKRS